MKAVVLRRSGGLERLRLVDQADPGSPGPGQVRVAIHGSSLNFNDYTVATGDQPTAPGRVPMADGGGVVEEVGDGVTEFRAGDKVVSTFFPDWLAGEPSDAELANVPGSTIDGFAQEVVVRSYTAFTHAPKQYDAVEAAAITTAGLTAWRALVADGKLKAGDTVLLLGTGGVSIWALQIARTMGARIAITSSSDEKLARATTLGAEFTVNYRHHRKWARPVVAWTEGRGVDHVLEVGGPATLAQSIESIRIGGHIAMIGILTGESGEVPTAALMAKRARVQGVAVGSRQDQQDFVRALDASGIHPIIDQRFKLADLAEAFRVESAGGHFGKIGVEW